MRRHRVATASIGLSAVLLSLTGVSLSQAQGVRFSAAALRSSTADIGSAGLFDGRAPFAPPPSFVPEETAPTPFIDVSGSIDSDKEKSPNGVVGTEGLAEAARPRSGQVVAGEAAMPPSSPSLAIAPPDPPAAPVIEATVPASPVAGLQTVDLADQLKSFAMPDSLRRNGESASRVRQRQSDRDAIAAVYAAHANAPLWIDGNHFSSAARAAIARIERAGEDGLDLHDFAVPLLRDPTPVQLAEAELALSEAVVAYAHQAGGSRIDPLQINRLITAKRTLADAAQVLDAVHSAAEPGTALQNFNPPQPGYAALRDKLAELRKATPVAKEGIPLGPTLRLGMRDARVPLVRSRFGLGASSSDPAGDDLVYDTKVVAAVAEFQKVNGLPASGTLTPRTIAALSGGNPTRLENELVANMERWRWVPRDLGAEHIDVNIPDYSLDVVQNGRVVHHARVVVGKPDHQTPVFSDAVRFIIVNPYWNVPLSIIKKEMLPKLAADPDYFANHGYEVVERNGITYVRQPPGEDNALGRIKFMFPNEHAVYLHDTNARALFGKDRRAFSHGCVRVDQPFKLAEIVLGKANGWNEKRIEKMIGGDERTISLPKPIPIHINYFTAFVDQDGGLQLRDDIYGYSAKTKVALGLSDQELASNH